MAGPAIASWLRSLRRLTLGFLLLPAIQVAPTWGSAIVLDFDGATVAPATVERFETLGPFSFEATGLSPFLPPGLLGLPVLNTGTSFAYLAASPPNVASLSPRVRYWVTLTDGSNFDFVGANFARSHAEGSLFDVGGWRAGARVFTAALEDKVTVISPSGSPGRFDLGWQDIDAVTVEWTGLTFPCCSTGFAVVDDITIKPSVETGVNPIPEPPSRALLLSGVVSLLTGALRRGS